MDRKIILDLTVDYRAASGQCLMLCVDKPRRAETVLRPVEGTDSWTARLEVEPGEELLYNFRVADSTLATVRSEWPSPHRIAVPLQGVERLDVADRWHDSPTYAPMLSSAFTRSIFRRPDAGACREAEGGQLGAGKVEIQVLAPQVEPHQTLVMAGEAETLGHWDPAKAPRLSDCRFPLWTLTLDRDTLPPQGCDFKFCIVDTAGSAVAAWEECPNRRLSLPPAAPGEATIVAGLQFEQRQPQWRGTGTVIPVFSLRSTDSFGIGDFHDLGLMVDWVAATGQNVLQILPVNDTTMTGRWSDSYPYNAISVFALHPIYLKVEELGTVSDSTEALVLATEKKALNSLSRIDYEKVFAAKMEYARTIYRQSGSAILQEPDYLRFAGRNHRWLDAYAAFCVLRDRYATPDMSRWGDYAVYSPEAVSRLLADEAEAAGFYRWLQYHLHRQLKAVTDRARSLGVVLKGDIPIGISRCSVDAWQNPELFNLDWCAGAPPDAFATDGQNWGFPTYNWERMAADGYAWWRMRLEKMAEYFDAYRIDHLLGFFRIWQIPRSKRSGLLGIFYPALPFTASEMLGDYGFAFSPDMTRGVASPTDVLFIADPADAERFHPAIDGPKTPRFEALPPAQQEAYIRLHNDFFYRRNDSLWEQQALTKLTPLLADTAMLACGEDLGMIPACVKPTMERLRILSLEVQRMPKTYGRQFDDTASYPYLSVATTSTHDMPGLRLWLDENPADAGRRLLQSLGIDNPATPLSAPEYCEAIVRNHLQSPSMLCVLPWQDWMAIDGRLRRPEAADETINIPAVANHYWRYRMHLDLGQLLAADTLNSRIRRLIADTRRRP